MRRQWVRDVSGVVVLGYLAGCSVFVWFALVAGGEALGGAMDSPALLLGSVAATALVLAVPVVLHGRVWMDTGESRTTLIASLVLPGALALAGLFALANALGD